ncbi:MAG: hypothetical protein CYPHOPRED_003759 [Cyphobasidiales sp. Tagirdzhanova-0007]|nr:MAG: hypothetical protein CYPHOPRED_003759 [Cyphobasidiales sp. Tagirdzhanova-0007]
MPKANRARSAKHEPAVPLGQTGGEDEGGDSMQLGLDFGQSTSNSTELDSAADSGSFAGVVTKKEKKKSKREALMQRLAERARPESPYSRSHNRRVKRREKQSLGLGSIEAALEEAVTPRSAVWEPVSINTIPDATVSKSKDSPILRQSQTKSKKLALPGKIGADTTRKQLSSKQRQNMLKHEQNRLPAILAHKSFATSPFETIRLHAQNTVIPLERSRSPYV